MYETKEKNYFMNIRNDLIGLIPEAFRECNVLEIGCGNGATLYKLKQLGIAKTSTGVELSPSKDNYYDTIDYFFAENIEEIVFSSFMHNSFDIIILGDVLEHLIDPWLTLKTISNLLKNEGIIILSIPNFRYHKVIKSILFDGDFKYEEAGILDRTHLRFFCRKNIIELLNKSNLKIDIMTSFFDQETSKSKKFWLNKLTFKFFHDYFIYQFLIVAKKKS